MTSFRFQKSLLAISATAALAGMLFNTQALAAPNNEEGSIELQSFLFASTCVLAIDSAASTVATSAKKTLELGSFSVSNASSVTPGGQIGLGDSVVLSLREANGTTPGCALLTTGKWDVSVDLPASAISTTNLTGKHSLNNTSAGGAGGIAASLKVAKNGGTASPALLGNKFGAFAHMLSGSTTIPSLNATDTLTVTAEMFRLNSGALVTGEYKANVPLTVVYR